MFRENIADNGRFVGLFWDLTSIPIPTNVELGSLLDYMSDMCRSCSSTHQLDTAQVFSSKGFSETHRECFSAANFQTKTTSNTLREILSWINECYNRDRNDIPCAVIVCNEFSWAKTLRENFGKRINVIVISYALEEEGVVPWRSVISQAIFAAQQTTERSSFINHPSQEDDFNNSITQKKSVVGLFWDVETARIPEDATSTKIIDIIRKMKQIATRFSVDGKIESSHLFASDVILNNTITSDLFYSEEFEVLPASGEESNSNMRLDVISNHISNWIDYYNSKDKNNSSDLCVVLVTLDMDFASFVRKLHNNSVFVVTVTDTSSEDVEDLVVVSDDYVDFSNLLQSVSLSRSASNPVESSDAMGDLDEDIFEKKGNLRMGIHEGLEHDSWADLDYTSCSSSSHDSLSLLGGKKPVEAPHEFDKNYPPTRVPSFRNEDQTEQYATQHQFNAEDVRYSSRLSASAQPWSGPATYSGTGGLPPQPPFNQEPSYDQRRNSSSSLHSQPPTRPASFHENSQQNEGRRGSTDSLSSDYDAISALKKVTNEFYKQSLGLDGSGALNKPPGSKLQPFDDSSYYGATRVEYEDDDARSDITGPSGSRRGSTLEPEDYNVFYRGMGSSNSIFSGASPAALSGALSQLNSPAFRPVSKDTNSDSMAPNPVHGNRAVNPAMPNPSEGRMGMLNMPMPPLPRYPELATFQHHQHQSEGNLMAAGVGNRLAGGAPLGIAVNPMIPRLGGGAQNYNISPNINNKGLARPGFVPQQGIHPSHSHESYEHSGDYDHDNFSHRSNSSQASRDDKMTSSPQSQHAFDVPSHDPIKDVLDSITHDQYCLYQSLAMAFATRNVKVAVSTLRQVYTKQCRRFRIPNLLSIIIPDTVVSHSNQEFNQISLSSIIFNLNCMHGCFTGKKLDSMDSFKYKMNKNIARWLLKEQQRKGIPIQLPPDIMELAVSVSKHIFECTTDLEFGMEILMAYNISNPKNVLAPPILGPVDTYGNPRQSSGTPGFEGAYPTNVVPNTMTGVPPPDIWVVERRLITILERAYPEGLLGAHIPSIYKEEYGEPIYLHGRKLKDVLLGTNLVDMLGGGNSPGGKKFVLRAHAAQDRLATSASGVASFGPSSVHHPPHLQPYGGQVPGPSHVYQRSPVPVFVDGNNNQMNRVYMSSPLQQQQHHHSHIPVAVSGHGHGPAGAAMNRYDGHMGGGFSHQVNKIPDRRYQQDQQPVQRQVISGSGVANNSNQGQANRNAGEAKHFFAPL